MKTRSLIIKIIVIGLILVFGVVLTSCEPTNPNDDDLPTFTAYAEYSVGDISNLDNAVLGIKLLLVINGYEVSVKRQGANGIRIEALDEDDLEDIIDIMDILDQPAKIELRLDDGKVILIGDDVESVNASNYYGEWVIRLKLNSEGTVKFATATTEHWGEAVNTYVIFGDEEALISRAMITEPITDGQAIISGQFTKNSAQNLANQIMSGKLGITLELLNYGIIV